MALPIMSTPPRRRPSSAVLSSSALRMLLLVCGVSFVLVQVRMLFVGTDCTDRVRVLLESERKWSKEARDLRLNLTALSREAAGVEAHVEKLQADYKAATKLYEDASKELEKHKQLLAAAAGSSGTPLSATGTPSGGGTPRGNKMEVGGGVKSGALAVPGTQQGAEGGVFRSKQGAEGGGGDLGGGIAGGTVTAAGAKLGREPVMNATKLVLPPKITKVEMRPEDAVAAVVVMTCNRAPYLLRTIKSILEVHSSPGKFPLFISQDGRNQEVHDLALKHTRFHYIQHIEEKPPVMKSRTENIAYYRIAEHYKFALSYLFDQQKFRRVILLEDDMELSPDFFDYFEATSDLLDVDPSLMAVSSWNDNGQEQFVSDPEALYRSDFFPGLGWMLRKELWDELKPKWPKAYWDDWMRLPEVRNGRQSIRPEICRTYNFGEVGSSFGQFFRDFLAPIKLNNVKVDWRYKDLSFLLDVIYPAHFLKGVKAAKATTVENLRKLEKLTEDVIVEYTDEGSFAPIARALGIFEEWKAGIPRTSYKGVVAIRYKGPHIVYLVNWSVLNTPPSPPPPRKIIFPSPNK